MNHSLEDLQRDVQRRLGRNLIRLQQIERLLKSMIADQCIESTTIAPGERSPGQSTVEKKTLGQVRDMYFDTVVVPEGYPEKDWAPPDLTRPVFRATFNVVMAADQRAAHLKEWDELVELRNLLVHHFLENQDLWTGDGCINASDYLDACYDKINRHYTDLMQMVRQIAEIREHIADFTQTDGFLNYLLYGIPPAGASVDWETAPIVSLLRGAENELSQQGWTRLDDAVAWLHLHHPNQMPANYGCKSWPQVLHVSRQFEIQRRPTENTATRAERCFRSRQSVPRSDS